MRDKIPTLTTILLLITLVLGTWWSAHYTMSTIEIDPPRRLTHEPDSWSYDFTMLRTDEHGNAINRLDGDYLEHYPDDDSYFIREAVATGLRADRPLTTGRSDEALMDQDGDRITMTGDAHVHRVPTPERAALDIYSDVLVLLPQEDIVHTDQPALVIDGRSTMEGIRSEEHTSELQSRGHLVCRLLLAHKKEAAKP